VHAQLWAHYVDENCFLAPSQRERLIAEYKERVGDAKDAYRDAVNELRLHELLQKDESAPFMLGLLLDVIGLVATPAIARALKRLINGTAAALQTVDDPSAISAAASRIPEKQLAVFAKQAVGLAKTAVPAPRPSDHEKTANLAYLAYLKSVAETAFQRIAEDLRDKTDPELLVLHDAYAVDNGHHSADYLAELEAQLRHFEESGVGTLGVEFNHRPSGAYGPFEPLQIDTKAFWVTLPAGRRLALYRRGHQPGTAEGDLVARPLPLFGVFHATTHEEAARNRERCGDQRFEFVRYVPDDLVDVAISMHEEKWGAAPSEHAPDGAEWPGLMGVAQ
jgi:hypothetical protein